MKNSSLISIFSFFRFFNHDFVVYAYFTYAATASTIIDDVTKLVMYGVFRTNL